jgi:hypothetical protein
MGSIISSLVFTRKDDRGNPITEAYLLWEFRDANYTPGGENINLTSLFRRVEHIAMWPASGALEYNPRPNYGDFPANAGSGRVQLWYSASGIVTLNISGLPVQILSGTSLTLASGNTVGGPISGRVGLPGSGAFNAGIAPVEILSGTAVSGIRTKLHVLGY